MVKILCLVLGVLFLVLGFIGLMLPVIPQVPFLAASMFFFMLGSERFATWIKSTKPYQQYIRPFLTKSRVPEKILEKIDANAGTRNNLKTSV